MKKIFKIVLTFALLLSVFSCFSITGKNVKATSKYVGEWKTAFLCDETEVSKDVFEPDFSTIAKVGETFEKFGIPVTEDLFTFSVKEDGTAQVGGEAGFDFAVTWEDKDGVFTYTEVDHSEYTHQVPYNDEYNAYMMHADGFFIGFVNTSSPEPQPEPQPVDPGQNPENGAQNADHVSGVKTGDNNELFVLLFVVLLTGAVIIKTSKKEY